MNGYPFVWDEDKNETNIRKHGVSFREAESVFHDADAIFIADEAHSQDEERFIVIGISANSRVLMVCHCYRNGDAFIRIISARKATKTEIKLYGGVL